MAVVAPGRWEYRAGGGVCPEGNCDFLSFLDLQHGLTLNTTLGGGAELLADSAGYWMRPHASAAFAFLERLAGDIRVSPSLTSGRLQLLGGRRWHGSFSGMISSPEARQPTFREENGRVWQTTAHVTYRVRGANLQSLGAGVSGSGSTLGGDPYWRFSGTANLRRWYLDGSYELLPDRPSNLAHLRVNFVTPGDWPTWIRHSGMSAGVTLAGSEVDRVELSSSLRLLGESSLNLTARLSPTRDAWDVVAGFSRNLGPARWQARASATSTGRVTSHVSAEGTVTHGSPQGLRSTLFGGTGMAGLSGMVFYDESGDGRMGEGDRPAPGVVVVAGGQRVRTDRRGIYHVWGLPAVDVVVVGLDTVSVPDPGWVPASPAQALRLTPNLHTRVDFALVRTVEMFGQVVAGQGIATTGGVQVEIVDVSADTVVATVRTFADGEFYISRMRPGTYRARVAEASLAALRARSEPAGVEIIARADEPFAEAPRIILSREEIFAQPPLAVDAPPVAPVPGDPAEEVQQPEPEARPLPPPPPAAPPPAEERVMEPLGVPAEERVAEALDVPLAPPAPTRLHGTVRDAGTGLPLAARISAVPADGGPTVQADADPSSGGFILDLRPGTIYGLQVTAPAYTPESVALDLTGVVGGGFLTADVGLVRLPERPLGPEHDVVRLEGTIRDTETERPLAARVLALPADGGPPVEVTSDATNGRFRLDLPAGARYTLHISAPGYGPEQASLNLTARLTHDRLIVNAGLRRLP